MTTPSYPAAAVRPLLPDAHDTNRRYLLIGTGTGVTPYRAMLPQLRELMAVRGVEVVLLFGARTPAELIYGEDFRAFAEGHPGFRFVPCFSRELPADPHPDVRKGYVQELAGRVRARCPSPTSPICAAIRTWSMPLSRP